MSPYVPRFGILTDMTATLAPELSTRLERLATVRRVATDALVSDVIRAYLDREEPYLIPARRRVPGGDEGKVILAPDFNAPLSQDIEDSFYE